MNFSEIAHLRQSCRSFDPRRTVAREDLQAILETARLAPSACNGQPYRITVCRGEAAHAVAGAVGGLGMNRFAKDVPLFLVLSEEGYVASAALGGKRTGIDYRSIDLGILCAYITAEATARGIASCILGWLDDSKLRSICGTDRPTRLVIALGYAKEGDPLREKKRKSIKELVAYCGE